MPDTDAQYLYSIVSMANAALTETEWKNRKSAVEAIGKMVEKMLTRPENVAEWKKVEEAMGKS